MPVEQWYTSNATVAYPFVSSTNATTIERYVDAYIIPAFAPTNGRIRLQQITVTTVSPWVVRVILRRTDALPTPTTWFDSNDAGVVFQAIDIGPWSVLEWKKSATKEFVRLVVQRSKMSAGTTFPIVDFVDRVVDHRAARLEALYSLLLIDNPSVISGPASGIVELQAGYNIDLQVEESGVQDLIGFTSTETPRGRTRVRIGAIPGAGAGVYPSCFAAPAIASINGISANTYGDFSLDADGCMWAERPGINLDSLRLKLNESIVGESPNIIKLHQDCTRCCECEEYYDIYEVIRTQWTRLQNVFDRFNRVKQKYEDTRTQWLAAQAGCPNVIVEPKLRPVVGWRVATTILIQNPLSCEITNLNISQLSIAVTSPTSTGVIVPNTASVYAGGHEVDFAWNPLGVSGYTLTTLYSGRFLVLSFEIQVQLPHQSGQNVQVSGTVTADNMDPVPIVASTQLVGPFNRS